jgi:hypothetical protein
MANKQSKLTFVIDIDNKGKIKIDGIKSSFSDLEQKVKSAATSTDSFNKKNVDLIATSGLAGATLTEFGRTISDSNYGIRGMANNLSQLSTLFITLIGKAGNFRKALSILGTQLMGPMGIILAFQAVIALLERFSMEQDAAAESTRNLTEALDEQQLMFDVLAKRINKYNVTGKALEQTVKVLSSEFSQFRTALESLEDKTPESIQKLIYRFMEYQDLQKEITLTQEQIKADVDARIPLEEKLFKLILRRSELEGEFTKNTKNSNKEQEKTSELILKTIADYNNQIKILRDAQTQTATTADQYTVLEKRIETLLEKIRELRGEGETPLVKSIIPEDKDIEIVAEDVSGILNDIGREYDSVVKRTQESLKNGLAFIKEQAKDVSKLFKATQQSLDYVSTTIMSYHDARMEALARERDYALHSGKLTASQQREAIADIEKREIKAQERKIKSERDLFTIKQSLLIAEEIMKFKFEIAARKRELADKITTITAEGITQIGKAQMSAGTFAAQGGPLGLATFAITIGGLIASIVAARKKANAALSALGAPSTGGGGGLGVEAPDFNVVGASPESQLAQSVSRQQTQPLRAFVVNKDIKDAEELDRTIDFNRSLG